MNKTIKYLTVALSLIMVSCSDEGDSIFLGSGDGFTAVSGSNTGFTMIGDYLYAISFKDLTIYNIGDSSEIVLENRIEIPTDTETIFGYQQYLLFGRQNGISVYDVSQNPTSPVFLSEYAHQTACDPVIARDGVAYFTIRSGNGCGPDRSNQLVVLDISDPTSPVLRDEKELFSPRGLAISGNQLYVSDGSAGIKQFDISNKFSPEFITTPTGNFSHDLIALDTVLISVGSNSVDQYRINGDQLNLLSSLR